MSTVTLNGHDVTRARVQVPDFGAWWADADLAEPEAIARGSAVTLVIADKTLVGTVVSGEASEDLGRAAYRIVGGSGGWGKSLPRKSYHNDFGVKASLVIGDAAAECGETVESAPTSRLGPHYARRAGVASAVLHNLAPRAWRVDFDGVTRFPLRTPITYSGSAARTRIDPAGTVTEYTVDEIGDLVPGVVIDGAQPATDVEYILEGKSLVVRVYASPRTSRRVDALSRIVDALTARLRYAGVFEYRVVSQSGERLNLQIVRSATGLGDLARVPVRPGMAGLRSNVALGELVLVAFADSDPSRPCVIAHDAPDAPGWMPLTIELGGPGALGVARVTDAVVAGGFGGTITTSSLRVKAVV